MGLEREQKRIDIKCPPILTATTCIQSNQVQVSLTALDGSTFPEFVFPVNATLDELATKVKQWEDVTFLSDSGNEVKRTEPLRNYGCLTLRGEGSSYHEAEEAVLRRYLGCSYYHEGEHARERVRHALRKIERKRRAASSQSEALPEAPHAEVLGSDEEANLEEEQERLERKSDSYRSRSRWSSSNSMRFVLPKWHERQIARQTTLARGSSIRWTVQQLFPGMTQASSLLQEKTVYHSHRKPTLHVFVQWLGQ